MARIARPAPCSPAIAIPALPALDGVALDTDSLSLALDRTSDHTLTWNVAASGPADVLVVELYQATSVSNQTKLSIIRAYVTLDQTLAIDPLVFTAGGTYLFEVVWWSRSRMRRPAIRNERPSQHELRRGHVVVGRVRGHELIRGVALVLGLAGCNAVLELASVHIAADGAVDASSLDTVTGTYMLRYVTTTRRSCRCSSRRRIRVGRSR